MLLFDPRPTHAGPALLLEAETGIVLYAEDQDQLWHPASLTKIMTAYIAFEEIKAGRLTLEQKIATSEAAHAAPPSKIGLPIGGEITVELALKALIIKSANDVAIMLAEAIGGSEEAFVARMNKTAARLGMSRTRFVNPNGLPAPEQVTTARDLALLSRAVLKEFPEYHALWSMPNMRIGRRRLGSHNALLRTYEGADGLKTGFICDSGFNVVATASRDGRQLMAVVLGETTGRDRAVRAASLLEHGFQTYGWKTYFSAPRLDALPQSASTAAVVSVRDEITSWDCGGRKAREARAAARAAARKARMEAKAKVAAAKKLAAASKAAATGAASTPTDGAAAAAAAPAPASAPKAQRPVLPSASAAKSAAVQSPPAAIANKSAAPASAARAPVPGAVANPVAPKAQ